MSGSTSSPIGCPTNRTPAIGRPLARDFLVPQNWIAITSARLKPNRRAVHHVRLSMTTRITMQIASRMRISDQEVWAHMFSRIPAEKAPYTTSTIDPRSNSLRPGWALT